MKKGITNIEQKTVLSRLLLGIVMSALIMFQSSVYSFDYSQVNNTSEQTENEAQNPINEGAQHFWMAHSVQTASLGLQSFTLHAFSFVEQIYFTPLVHFAKSNFSFFKTDEHFKVLFRHIISPNAP